MFLLLPQGAINLYTKDAINKFFLNHPMQKLDKRRLVIFHCEFSSQRAPSLLKYLRENDRNANLENYPALFYPELYLLHGGYKNFFESCKVSIFFFSIFSSFMFFLGKNSGFHVASGVILLRNYRIDNVTTKRIISATSIP